MVYDFSKINIPNYQPKPVDPMEIFRGAAITDSNINDLWLGQGDALREWNEHRGESDVAVVLNTGAGKTLVGLLIAQSLVNETRGRVVYACGSIQLVEQTADKARGYGLPVATYYRGIFSKAELYHGAEAPCVTTYQALFNGKSRFGSDDVAAVILDDAHTAEQTLRDQFSLSIARSELPRVFNQILALFLPYHKDVGLATSYAEVMSGESSRVFLVPPFEIQSHISELQRLLLQADLGGYLNTMFAWEHVRDREELCCLLISNSEITLTPTVVPVFSLPYFEDDIRRVYLSATLSAPDSFVRAFGRQPNSIISPSSPAGECERMILTPSVASGVSDDVHSTKEIVQDQKALILTPSFYKGNKWADIASLPDRENASAAIDSFRNAAPPEKLTLAARYDGLDLPGETCQVMVLDGLPQGSGPLERFQWERLNMRNSLQSLLASRIVQSFGRISRGMSDHGVVILTGKDLIEWLLLPRNRSLLPPFLQKQIAVGDQLSKGASSTDELKSMASACLSRDIEWIQLYNTSMRASPAASLSTSQDKALDVALAEARFGRFLWERDYESAAKALNDILDDAFQFSQYTGAWLSLWLGFALQMCGDNENASYYYKKAHASQSNMPRPIPLPIGTGSPVPVQITNISEQMRIGSVGSMPIQLPKSLAKDLIALNGDGSPAQVEEALRCLGQYLGLQSTRPDKEFGAGPDVLWLGEDRRAVCIEAKTGKQSTSYHKDDVGQLHNHVQWVKDNIQISDIYPVFVGQILRVSSAASPTPDMRVVELSQFKELGDRLASVLQDVASTALPLSLESSLHDAMKNQGLLYPEVFLNLDMTALDSL